MYHIWKSKYQIQETWVKCLVAQLAYFGDFYRDVQGLKPSVADIKL